MRDNLCMAKRFSNTVRYIDDLLTLNNSHFEEEIPNIYPPELTLKRMKSTKVQTLGRNIGTFGLETNLHAYVLGIYRTSFQHNLHCFIDACVHVVNDYIVSN